MFFSALLFVLPGFLPVQTFPADSKSLLKMPKENGVIKVQRQFYVSEDMDFFFAIRSQEFFKEWPVLLRD